MTTDEKRVWAAAFALVLRASGDRGLAISEAATAVLVFRGEDVDAPPTPETAERLWLEARGEVAEEPDAPALSENDLPYVYEFEDLSIALTAIAVWFERGACDARGFGEEGGPLFYRFTAEYGVVFTDGKAWPVITAECFFHDYRDRVLTHYESGGSFALEVAGRMSELRELRGSALR